MNIKPFALFASTLFCLNIFSQKIIISGEETNRKLVWSDFTGKVDKSAPYYAYTRFKIGFQTGNIDVIGDSVSIDKFEVNVELDPKESWAKKDKVSDALLIHEQGHFDIGILCMREILANYRQAKFTRTNVNYTIQTIVNNASRKYHEMTLKYDKETNHSADKEQQAKWNLFFSEMLSK